MTTVADHLRERVKIRRYVLRLTPTGAPLPHSRFNPLRADPDVTQGLDQLLAEGGLRVTVTGARGAGKTTIARVIDRALSAAGYAVLGAFERFPHGSSEIGDGAVGLTGLAPCEVAIVVEND